MRTTADGGNDVPRRDIIAIADVIVGSLCGDGVEQVRERRPRGGRIAPLDAPARRRFTEDQYEQAQDGLNLSLGA